MYFQVQLCSSTAKAPQRQSSGSAGYDVYSNENVNIPAGQRQLVDTGIKIKVDPSCYARVAPRSGLAIANIDIGAGVVDSDYRGLVKVLVINNSKEDFVIKRGDRIAQIIIENILTPMVEIVQSFENDSSERKEGGFGSTGMK